jgi:TRAP-type C4-dicarboxylate transport system permease small subunit
MKQPVEVLLRVLTVLIGLVLLAGVGLNFTNAVMRYGMGISLRWAEEILVFGLVLIVAVGLVVSTARAEHLRIDVLQGFLPRWVRVISHLVLAGTFLYLSMQSHAVVALMMRFGQQSVAARIPMWIPHGFLLIAFWLGAAACLYAIWREYRPVPGAVASNPALPDIEGRS